MKSPWFAAWLVWMVGSFSGLTDEPAKLDEHAKRLLQEAGAVSYAHKTPYAAGIDSLALGYNADGAVVAGVAARKTKTYKSTTLYLTVVPVDGQFQIRSALIPDLAEFHGKSQSLAQETLTDLKGKTVPDAQAARKLVDGVTGATTYRRAIYVSGSAIAAALIRELQAKPDWLRTAF